MRFEPDVTAPDGHKRLPAYYAHKARRWVAYCECGWQSAEQTWGEHVAEVVEETRRGTS